jgi:hypothetical protein
MKNQDADFSFGVREMRAVKKQAQPLSLDNRKMKVVNDDRGSDPYNTSGTFDRTKNWTRVGRR